MTNYILIDGSYFVFYRYYALLNWWKLAKKEIPATVHVDGTSRVHLLVLVQRECHWR